MKVLSANRAVGTNKCRQRWKVIKTITTKTTITPGITVYHKMIGITNRNDRTTISHGTIGGTTGIDNHHNTYNNHNNHVTQ